MSPGEMIPRRRNADVRWKPGTTSRESQRRNGPRTCFIDVNEVLTIFGPDLFQNIRLEMFSFCAHQGQENKRRTRAAIAAPLWV